MPTLTGILLDVSASMEDSIGGPVDQDGGSWARSIFRVVDQLIKHDVSSENKVFALGYGAKHQPVVFDLLNTVKQVSEERDVQQDRSKCEMLSKCLDILEKNGATYVREWASLRMLENLVTQQEANSILMMLEKNQVNFTQVFVKECLPVECRQKGSSLGAAIAENIKVSKKCCFPKVGQIVDSRVTTATIESIRISVDKGKELIWEKAASNICSDSVVNVHIASAILHGCVGKDGVEILTEDQVDTLMKNVEPFIYGLTPIKSALQQAHKLMSLDEFNDHNKLLFVLSDGMPTDHGPPPDLSQLNVYVIGCYITDSNKAHPKHLYSSKCQGWNTGANFMFDLSSSISSQQLPRTIFVKHGWKVDFENNETKLFLQVNHPEHIDEVCSFARDVVCCQDTLSDLLASVNLDFYINKANDGFEAKEQIGGTCYANASAAVLHLAMHRIIGRDGGYPDFFALRKELIDRYGVNGANTFQVLQEVCPKYRLQCKEVDKMGALKAVTCKRSVIVRFRLTDTEWKKFSKFYRLKPLGTLSKKDLDITKRSAGTSTVGHAVVLTSFNSKGLTLMNSWSSKWANNGFFSVENASVLGLEFVDVYWTLNDLYPSEMEAYKREGPRITAEKLASLKGLQEAKYVCPLCQQESLVREFTGRLVNAKCPKCRRKFNTNNHDAHDLVLNMYLTSLIAKD